MGAPVGEGDDGAHQLVPVAHGRGGEVDRHRRAVLGPQHLPPHPVLAPGAQRVGERRFGVREGFAVGPRVQDQRVELPAAQVPGAEAEDLRRRRVDQDDAPVGVGADDALGRRAQDHLGLPLRTGQLRLGVDGPGEVPDHDHQQFVAGVPLVRRPGPELRGGTPAGLPPLGEAGAGHLDGELGTVGPPGRHPRRPGAALLVDGVRTAHRSGDQPRVELREQIEQSAPHQRRTGRLQALQGDGVGVDDRAVAVDEHQGVGKRVEYCCEASSAS